MNPLKMPWFRMRAHLRLFHSWIMVQLDLHWKTRTHVRRRLVKAADWLEATLEIIDAQRRLSNNQANVNTISSAYKDLLNKMADIRAKDHPVREDIEFVKGKFLGLLDLCGIKDADIPLFDEPLRVRGTRQTLITNFGIMSKSLSATVTPSRNTTGRRARTARNTGNYADMLIEHLLANASPDSDTSPPSTEERTTSGLSSMGSRVSPGIRPSRQRQRNPVVMNNAAQSSSLSRHAYLALSHLSSPTSARRSFSAPDDSDRLLHSSHQFRMPTSDSGDPASEGSRAFCSPPLPPNTSQVLDDISMDKTLHYTTTGSTPELPVSVSSESLDIPFASFFDNKKGEYFERIDDFPDDELSRSTYSDVSESLAPSQDTCYQFPTRYSRSYARELHKVEDTDNFDCRAAPASATKGTNTSLSTEPLDNKLPIDELLVVQLPELPTATCLKCASNDELTSDSGVDYNINNNYKPHLEDKNTLVSSDPESPKPPIPPRRPLTDSKVGRFVLQSDNSGLGSLWCNQNSATRDGDFMYPKAAAVQIEPRNIGSMTTGKAYMKERLRHSPILSLSPRRGQLWSPQHARGSESLSASKRRKANDKSALPVEHEIRPPRPVRQRLFTSPRSSPSKTESPFRSNIHVESPSKFDSRSDRIRKKRHSPAMRRLIQQKESNVLSPSFHRNSPRKPLSEIYNICLNQSDPLTTSSNSLTPSSDAYAKSSETSPDIPLPSREEELRDRDAHYCDFTVDRQHKIDTLSPKERLSLYKKDVKENRYTLEDPNTNEILVRQVEGAESSPKSNVIFQVPKSNTRAPRAVQTQVARSTSNPHKLTVTPSSSARRSSTSSSTTAQPQVARSASNPHRSTAKPPTSARRSSSSSSSKSDHRRRSSRSSSRSTNSHPMASSTIIEHKSPDTDDVASSVPSLYTWTIEEETEQCNLEKSYIRSRHARRALKANIKPQTPRPPTSVGRDSPVKAKKIQPFEITAMVSEIDKHLNDTARGLAGANCDKDIMRVSHIKANHSDRNCSARHFLAGAPSLIGKAMTKNSVCNESDDSGSSSQQASTSSMVFNRARASIQCSSNEPSDIPDLRQISSVPSSSRTLSSSAPELTHSNASSVNDAAPESIAELSVLEEREEIPGKSNSSDSSSCTAARCRPRSSHLKEAKIDVESMTADADDQPEGNQDLIDSILTDSPKSVDSSGIFAPYNSYNSPAESVGSHNGYSSTVSSSIPSSDNYFLPPKVNRAVPPPTPVRAQSAEVFAVEKLPQKVEDNGNFKRPFNPIPHVSHTLQVPGTRNQGVSAMAQFIAPQRPMSVRSDPLASKSVFAVPPGVVTGPPKISDKKSLVKKLKKFSTNFYRKNEKIRTLANL